MSARLVACTLLFTVVVACQGKNVSEPSGAAPTQSEAGATDTAGANAEGGAAGDATSGTGGSTLSGGGEAGAGDALENVWNEHTQHIDIQCFGFFTGYAEFRADRSELSEAQLARLAKVTTAPNVPNGDPTGDTITDCYADTVDDDGTPHRYNDVIAYDPGPMSPAGSLIGCEFSAGIPSYDGFGPAPALPLPPGLGYSALPLCVHYLQTTGPVVTYDLNLDTPDRPYRIQLESCYSTPTKVELYGSDPNTPLAIGVTPVEPGPHHVCSSLEVRVDVPITGRLILTNSGDDQHLVFY